MNKDYSALLYMLEKIRHHCRQPSQTNPFLIGKFMTDKESDDYFHCLILESDGFINLYLDDDGDAYWTLR